jgi:glutamine amidotransferase
MIAIVDYGMGNIHSVLKAIESLGGNTAVALTPGDLEKADKIVLPGVGAFADAMAELKRRDLDTEIVKQIKNKKPFLGICLGMQLLFAKSYEGTGAMGLGVLSGVVEKFKPMGGNLKIPHIGWDQLKKIPNPPAKAGSQIPNECPILKNIPDNSYVYFCHSYYVVPKDKDIIAAVTDYGIDFTSMVYKDNIFGIQFHPEKSQTIGLKILENFVGLC